MAANYKKINDDLRRVYYSAGSAGDGIVRDGLWFGCTAYGDFQGYASDGGPGPWEGVHLPEIRLLQRGGTIVYRGSVDNDDRPSSLGTWVIEGPWQDTAFMTLRSLVDDIDERERRAREQKLQEQLAREQAERNKADLKKREDIAAYMTQYGQDR